MQSHDRIPRSELGQFTCRLGHLRFDNVYGILAYWNILYVERFKVLGSFTFAFVIHFTQQVHDLIAHDATAPHVGVDEQGLFGGTQHVLEGRVQIDELPVYRSASS